MARPGNVRAWPWQRRPSPRRAAWYPSPDGTLASLDWMLGNTRNMDNPLHLPRGGMMNAQPVVKLPCEIVLTMARGSNGKVMHVRCRCMAGTATVPQARFYVYDAIGQAGSIEEAKQMWKDAGHG